MVNPFQFPAAKKTGAQSFQFVESVRVRNVRRPRKVNRRLVLLGGFWFLIAVKCLLVHWAILHWQMPVGSVYVWAPTVLAGVLCTVVYLASGKEE